MATHSYAPPRATAVIPFTNAYFLNHPSKTLPNMPLDYRKKKEAVPRNGSYYCLNTLTALSAGTAAARVMVAAMMLLLMVVLVREV